MPLPKWQSHKVVSAAPVISVMELPPAPGSEQSDVRSLPQYAVVFDDLAGGQGEITIAGAVFSRGIAAPGDYLVVYDDGYTSWSPKAAFEEGYTRI